MIICAFSTSRSREQSPKRRSSNVILFYSQNDYQTWPMHLFQKFTRCAKVYGLIFLIVLFGCWLAGQANSDHVVIVAKTFKKMFAVISAVRSGNSQPRNTATSWICKHSWVSQSVSQWDCASVCPGCLLSMWSWYPLTFLCRCSCLSVLVCGCPQFGIVHIKFVSHL